MTSMVHGSSSAAATENFLMGGHAGTVGDSCHHLYSIFSIRYAPSRRSAHVSRQPAIERIGSQMHAKVRCPPSLTWWFRRK